MNDSWLTLAVAQGVALLLLGAAMLPLLIRNSRAATTAETVVHGAFFLALFSLLYFIIPRFQHIFEGFDLELPLLTGMLLALSRWTAVLGLAGVIVPLVVTGGDAMLFSSLHDSHRTRNLARIFSAIVSAVCFLVLQVSVVALFLPLIKLLNDLS